MNAHDLHWTESTIERIVVSGRSLSIVASNVLVLGEVGARRVRVTYTGLAEARQEATGYIGDPAAPDGFMRPQTVELIEPLSLPGTASFGLEGISAFEPVSWLDIEIKAQGATVEEL